MTQPAIQESLDMEGLEHKDKILSANCPDSPNQQAWRAESDFSHPKTPTASPGQIGESELI